MSETDILKKVDTNIPGILTKEDLCCISTKKELREILRNKKIPLGGARRTIKYEKQLRLLQIEMGKLQRWVNDEQKRVAIIFEGRDAAGKGGAIRRFTEHMNPRSKRVVALPKPTYQEMHQWYFQRYIKALPNPGEVVFFDRSWYNRAVVEPVMGFCNDDQYETFMQQVPEFEHMLYEDGIILIKFWFSITKDEQASRFNERRTNPLKQWKISPVDEKAQSMWDRYSKFKELMFARTHTSFAPWVIVQTNSKKVARLESIRYALSQVDYAGKEDAEINLFPDPNIVMRYHRLTDNLD